MPNVCITGANRGIGLALAKQYSQKHQVYALCRQSSDELDSLNKTKVITGFDMNDPKARETSAAKLENIDLLILNAGILLRDESDLPTLEASIVQQIQTNAISPIIFAKMAVSCLSPNAKIMLMTSRMGSIDDNETGGLYGYRMSKTALNSGGCNLAHELIDQNIAVFLVHPGYIQTDMTNHTGRNSPEEAADNIYQLLEKLNMENTGQFWHAEGHQLHW